ncbi:MAG: hypothetical protein COB67_00140 [SAR324 cluster bacterium]|uniref:CobQ/CobB/MinD/ParA nucleotide binding domain-containing protein n=1 Tax=SAR324 cluster bacterium TaxID=2024889 RepID=A0A2A4TBJ7_9DELT|nr:MAG: hypothetical protein COB67_00140 [SAR324 cluster bacterium]
METLTKSEIHIRIAERFKKSVSTIRTIEQENPNKYSIMYDAVFDSVEEYDNTQRKTIIIALLTFKGGSGKSTLANLLASNLSNAVVLNLDISQTASECNAATTVDFSEFDSELNAKEVIEDLKQNYDYIIVDTPGEISGELLDLREHIDHFIIPFSPGKRARETTIETVEQYFGEGTNYFEGDYKLMFILNQYLDDVRLKDDAKKLIASLKEVNIDKKIKFQINMSALKQSRAIATMEDNQMDINSLDETNRVAYRVAKKRINSLCNTIKKNFILEEVE